MSNMETRNYGERIINEISDIDRRDAEEKNSKSIVVRIINRVVTEDQARTALPRIWNAVERVTCRPIGNNTFQFFFEERELLEQVLSSAPFIISGGAIAVERWTKTPGTDYLNQVPVWVVILGVPSHLASEETIDSICRCLGKIDSIRLGAGPTYRAKVWMSIEKPLTFRMAKEVGGELIHLRLRYPDITFCGICDRITHDETLCSSRFRDGLQLSVVDSENLELQLSATVQPMLVASERRQLDRRIEIGRQLIQRRREREAAREAAIEAAIDESINQGRQPPPIDGEDERERHVRRRMDYWQVEIRGIRDEVEALEETLRTRRGGQ